MFIGTKSETNDTLLPDVHCKNFYCPVKPKCKYVPIRKQQRFNPIILKEKIEKVIGHWNDDNPMIATEGIELDFDDVAKNNLPSLP